MLMYLRFGDTPFQVFELRVLRGAELARGLFVKRGEVILNLHDGYLTQRVRRGNQPDVALSRQFLAVRGHGPG